MASTRPKSTELSEFTSFSVAPIEGDSANTRVTVTYKNPGDLNREPPLSFKFFISGQEPVEKPMVYSEERKQWELSLDVSNNVRGYFQINGRTPQELNLELKDGEPYPWIYKDKSVAQGTLTRCLYKADGSINPLVSDTKDTTLEIGDRLVTVYLPPGYNPERKPPYNLQITLDGDDLYAAIPTNVTLDNLIAAKKIDPVVAVFIPPWHGPPDLERYPTGEGGPPGYSHAMRIKEYACNTKVAANLVSLPATLRESFNVTQDPEQTVITGISISGVQALYTALSYPDVFGNVIAQSPALHWGPNVLLMSELPDPDQKYMQASIITPDGLYQLNENKTEYTRFLDLSDMKKLGLDELIKEGLKKGNVSFYHALSLAQFRELNRALKDNGAKFDINGNAGSAWLPDMISEGGHFAKPDKEKPLKVWLQSGIKQEMPMGELDIAEQTEITAELLRQQKYTVAGEVIHQGGHYATHWRCGLPDALVAMHQPVKVAEAKLTFDELQVQAALSKSKADGEASSSLDSPLSKSEVNTSGSIQDKAKEKEKEKDSLSNPDGSTRTRRLT